MPNELELYPHNEKAYRKLLDMLSETRRACIIHPTGTGKAFIAYRYAFDHPKERILWMSPSTYIEQEQEVMVNIAIWIAVAVASAIILSFCYEFFTK